jgi:hypothetical protein
MTCRQNMSRSTCAAVIEPSPDVRDFIKNPLLRRLILGEQPEGPRQCHSGRLVAGSDEGEKIVHDFSVVHAAPGFRVAGGEQEVEKVRLGRSFCTPRLDQAAHVPMQEIARLQGAASIREGHPFRNGEHRVDEVPRNGLEVFSGRASQVPLLAWPKVFCEEGLSRTLARFPAIVGRRYRKK